MDGFYRDQDVVSCALSMWANYIQTGDVTLSPQDAKNRGCDDRVKVLSDEQMRFVLRLRDMSNKKWVSQ